MMNLQASWPRTWPTIWLSEQVQSALGLGVSFGRDLGVRAAGGFLVQVLPFAEDETIAQVGAVGPSKYGRGWVRELRAN